MVLEIPFRGGVSGCKNRNFKITMKHLKTTKRTSGHITVLTPKTKRQAEGGNFSNFHFRDRQLNYNNSLYKHTKK